MARVNRKLSSMPQYHLPCMPSSASDTTGHNRHSPFMVHNYYMPSLIFLTRAQKFVRNSRDIFTRNTANNIKRRDLKKDLRVFSISLWIKTLMMLFHIFEYCIGALFKRWKVT